MVYTKEVYRIDRDGNKTMEIKECHPRQMPLTSKYIAPYWFEAIQNVFKYQKRRDLVEVHKLVSDDRIKRGLDLYREKKIEHNVVTTVNGGDVHATVGEYTVVMKNFLPPKLPQYNYEREEYIANLFISCNCKDSQMGRYRDNASLICKHVAATIWYLQAAFNMPVIFVSPEAKELGYSKSNTEELATDIKALPLVRFTQYINILLLKKFRGISCALGISIHKINNETNKEETKPAWLTYIQTEDVERLMKGMSKAYREMMKSKGIPEANINNRLCNVLEIKPQTIEKEIIVAVKEKEKKWYQFWR
jgi:hypothetical protein